MQPYFLNSSYGYDPGIIFKNLLLHFRERRVAKEFSREIDLKRCVIEVRKWRGEAALAKTKATNQTDSLLKPEIRERKLIICA
jgi:hypothetical protein